MENLLVSILIPCHNGEKFVREAVESAFAQTHSPVEVVVVDDGSTDGSVRVLGQLQAEFGERFRFEAGPNRGACAARNRAFELSRGEFVQFLDADDLILPQKIEKQLPFLLSSEFGFVFCKGYLFGDGRPARPIKRALPSPDGVDAFIYFLRHPMGTEAPLHHRACLEKIGGFRESLPRAQEFDLHLRLGASNARIHLLDELLFHHRHHDGPRITRTAQAGDYMLRLLLELTDVLESGPPYALTEPRCEALAGSIFQHSIYAFRNGAEETAKTGFRRARRLSARFSYEERKWYRVLAHFTGPVAVEKFLKQGRFLRNALRHGAKEARD